MYEEIFHNFYKIEVPLPGNPLKYLNSYYIKGKDRELLIDTGFDQEECKSAIQEALRELHSDDNKRDILLTHFHGDHSSLAYFFLGHNCSVYISKTDFQYRFLAKEDLMELIYQRFLKEGVDKYLISLMRRDTPTKASATFQLPHSKFCMLEDGDTLQVGDYSLRTVLVPGHTPGNIMLYIDELKAMLTGDHVLFDITPNITAWPNVDNSLQDFLKSLEKAKSFDVLTALPGHRKTGNYTERIEQLEEHHRKRIGDTLHIIETYPNQNAYFIAGQMSWKIRCKSWDDFPAAQKIFAIGECLSHLDYLVHEGIISKNWNGISNTYCKIEA